MNYCEPNKNKPVFLFDYFAHGFQQSNSEFSQIFSTKIVPLFILPKHNLAKFGEIGETFLKCELSLNVVIKNTLITIDTNNKFHKQIW